MTKGRDGVWRVVPDTYVTEAEASDYFDRYCFYILDEAAPVDWEEVEKHVNATDHRRHRLPPKK